jgi:predicted XRE-type DNA-binding protein
MSQISPRTLRTIVTVVLVFILAAILGGYIYVGMYYAKLGDKVADTPQDAAPTLSKRDQILEAMTDAPAVDPVKRAEIISTLNTDTASSVDQAKRQKVLDALAGKSTQNP